MSPRTPKIRSIQRAPNFSGFKPVGVMGKQGKEMQLLLEEYEALKLCDYELLTQAEAAIYMNISRPTFTRVYESARRKIARALVETSPVIINGGRSQVDIKWYKCEHCRISFSVHNPDHLYCPLCKSDNITDF